MQLRTADAAAWSTHNACIGGGFISGCVTFISCHLCSQCTHTAVMEAYGHTLLRSMLNRNIKGDDLSISVPRHRVLFRLPRLLLLLQPQPTGACIPFADLEYKGSQKIAETLHLTLWASFAL